MGARKASWVAVAQRPPGEPAAARGPSSRAASAAAGWPPELPRSLGAEHGARCRFPARSLSKRDWAEAAAARPGCRAAARSRSRSGPGTPTAAATAAVHHDAAACAAACGARRGTMAVARLRSGSRRAVAALAGPMTAARAEGRRANASARRESDRRRSAGSGNRTKPGRQGSATRRTPSKIGTCLRCCARSVGRLPCRSLPQSTTRTRVDSDRPASVTDLALSRQGLLQDSRARGLPRIAGCGTRRLGSVPAVRP